ncbi:MAG: flgL [Herminiimonas sp.]|nr:flgL [Herminiimonas sp.]
MRISTNTMFDTGISRISDLQASAVKTQEQLSTGRRILTPADDPIAAARALDLTQGQSINTQFGVNRQNAKDALSQEEGVLQSVTSLIHDAQTQAVAAGNGAYDDTQRKTIAIDLRTRFDELVGLANSRDGVGNYLFSGYQTTAQPYSQSAAGVQYVGDQGQKLLQVGAAQQMSIGDSGDAIFNNIPGTNTFVSAAAAGNAGNATVTPASVVDAAALAPAPGTFSYDVTFTVPAAPGIPTYQVDTVPAGGVPVATGNYVSGQPIQFNGLQITVTDGATVLATGDKFTVRPSQNQSLFTTMNDLINLLGAPTGTPAGKANLTQGLATANSNLANALDNVSAVRASVGSRLYEIDSLDSGGSYRDIQYAQTLSTLQNVDYAKAISDLAQQTTTLTAAQQSFVKISGLSLFNFIT